MGLTTNIKLVEAKMLEKAKEFALKFNKDISSIGLDKIFEGYVSKYYNVKDYEQYLFGQQEISPLNSQVNLYSQRYDDGFISRNTSSRNSQSRRSSNQQQVGEHSKIHERENQDLGNFLSAKQD